MTAQDAAIAAAISRPGGASDLIPVIKGYAKLQADPATVYGLAQIPTPLPPVPLPAPGVPEKIQVALEPSGAVTLSCEPSQAPASPGAYFTVSRKLPRQTAFTLIGGSPGSTTESRRMSFTDSSIPTSAAGAGAQYIVQGQRGTRVGEMSEAITVHFGVNGAGFTVMGGGSGLRMAA